MLKVFKVNYKGHKLTFFEVSLVSLLLNLNMFVIWIWFSVAGYQLWHMYGIAWSHFCHQLFQTEQNNQFLWWSEWFPRFSVFFGVFLWLNFLKRSSKEILSFCSNEKLSIIMKVNQQYCILIWKSTSKTRSFLSVKSFRQSYPNWLPALLPLNFNHVFILEYIVCIVISYQF